MRHANSILPCDDRVKSTCTTRASLYCAKHDIRLEADDNSFGYSTKQLQLHVLNWKGIHIIVLSLLAVITPVMSHESQVTTTYTYTLSKGSPTNTVLNGPQGVEYVISTPFRLGGTQTTITQGGRVIATIQWNIFKKDTVTIDDRTSTVKEAFPKMKLLSTSRTYTTLSGERFKWKGTNKLRCISVETHNTLAMYERAIFSRTRKKPHVLSISSNADYLIEVLIVTWVIAEKKARNRRRTGGVSAVGSGTRRNKINSAN
ncbi:unnamed protein product [Rhizoctonia solani]|uniref:DUF6593 domain-containing protein n=1 Tax=Rhizoctonia solani TaxID=456999 RepID=A0A8H2WWB0_9AGAM|nr:unnamed protein product [Rhizoctonia solani]